jgi:hypothetical protein
MRRLDLREARDLGHLAVDAHQGRLADHDVDIARSRHHRRFQHLDEFHGLS